MPKTIEDFDPSTAFHAGFTIEVMEAAESKDGKTGKVKALVSAYNVDYRMGWRAMHRILPGAFAKSLASSASIPMFWQHNWSWSEQPPIGVATATEETLGLVIEGEFFLDTEAGRSVFNAIKAKALREWSIGYRITEYVIEGNDDDEDEMVVIQVKEAELLEASSVLRGANPQTDTLEAASKMPDDIYEALLRVSTWMQNQKAINGEILTRLSEVEEFMDDLQDFTRELDTAVKALEGVEAVTVEIAGEEELVEPADGGGSEEEPAAAAGSLKVPDFLPPASTPANTDDVGARARVLQAWNYQGSSL